ncbi:MAG: helix-turn-helix transcriptional regulator, partial [Hyphomonadaceae bacterium]|nr:helix-turn-helix transcriptional regulator [Hyphomonadaceae bacterium]
GSVLKLEVDGAEVKRLRSSRERSATQKEFAHEVGISERRLREIENAKGLIAVDVVDRLARALSVPRTQLCATAPAADSAMTAKAPEQDRFFPRFDTGIAEMVEDEAVLMDAAAKVQVVLLQIKIRLTEETQGYITELYELASSLSWSGGNRALLQTDGELPIRRRLRELASFSRATTFGSMRPTTSKCCRSATRFRPSQIRSTASSSLFWPLGRLASTAKLRSTSRSTPVSRA